MRNYKAALDAMFAKQTLTLNPICLNQVNSAHYSKKIREGRKSNIVIATAINRVAARRGGMVGYWGGWLAREFLLNLRMDNKGLWP